MRRTLLLLSMVALAGCDAQSMRSDREREHGPFPLPFDHVPPESGGEGTPTPTPTPSGPVYLDELWTPAGTPEVSAGKCLGFTLVGNTVTFEGASTLPVELGPLRFEATVVDATHARVGEEATGGDCTWIPMFLDTHGTYAPVVTIAGETLTLDETIAILPPALIDVGTILEERVWADGVFEQKWDTDIYLANFDDHIRRYADMDFFPAGPVDVVPAMDFMEERYENIKVAEGGLGLIFPQGGPNYVLVRDVQGRGSADTSYRLGFIADVLGDRRPADDCGGAPYITPRAYHVTYDSLSDDFHPSCPDSIYGNPIRGDGKDAVWKVKVPAHTQLRVSSYDDHIDNVVFLLPVADGCPHAPTTCAAAAGTFGGGSTDTLVYDNATGAEQEFYLVHDAAREYTHDPEHPEIENPVVGSFLIDVELFPH